MNRWVRGAIGVAAMTASVTAQSQRQPGLPGVAPIVATASAVVEGEITVADSGSPVRGAEVRMRATDGRENRLVTTDAEGRYRFSGLNGGEWTLTASKAGFISQQYGQRGPFDSQQTLRLRGTERLRANLQLRRAGAISGRLFDEFGDPIAGAQVTVMRTRMLRGRRTTVPVGVMDQTDDTGAYRIYALPPGEYYVGASLRLAPAENNVITAPATTPTFYPGTSTLPDAVRVQLGAGEELSNVNFSVQPAHPVSVSGTVLTSTGEPARPGLLINLTSLDATGTLIPIGGAGVVRGNGAFTISNITPGNYVVHVDAMVAPVAVPPVAGADPGVTEFALVPISVGTANVTGLMITLARGSSISGTIVAEDGGQVPRDLSYRVLFRSLMLSSGRSATLRGVSSFNMQGLFGPTAISVEDLSAGWMVRSIEINGEDVTDTPIDFRGQQNLVMRIVVTDRVTELDGTTSIQQRPAADANVVVFPEDPAKWNYPSRYVRTARTDPQGRFVIRGLPPDPRYLVAAIDYLDDGEAEDPEFLDTIKAKARALSIDFGDRRTIDVDVTRR